MKGYELSTVKPEFLNLIQYHSLHFFIGEQSVKFLAQGLAIMPKVSDRVTLGARYLDEGGVWRGYRQRFWRHAT